MENTQIIGILKETLKRKGISQRELASRIGRDETAVSRWLSGRSGISQSSLDAIEAAIGEKLVKS
ncbi:MAG: helix-turn-helix transcriptional regulator, partial [Atopobiaceae bacterium]|nr:helix-turn-helix transcriptional regulator [Atopobiaceae bacterium]